MHVDLVEFKCPAHDNYRNTAENPYAGKGTAACPDVQPYYFAQLQGIMGLLNEGAGGGGGVARVLTGCGLPAGARVRHAWFVVWQTHALHVTLVPYDEGFYRALHGTLRAFYFDTLLPQLVDQYNRGEEAGVEEEGGGAGAGGGGGGERGPPAAAPRPGAPDAAAGAAADAAASGGGGGAGSPCDAQGRGGGAALSSSDSGGGGGAAARRGTE
jgi:hypothetical protein